MVSWFRDQFWRGESWLHKPAGAKTNSTLLSEVPAGSMGLITQPIGVQRSLSEPEAKGHVGIGDVHGRAASTDPS